MKLSNTLLACAGILTASAAQAEGDWIFGLLATGGQSAYVGHDDDVALLPYIAYETDRLHIGIDEISYDVIESDQLEVAVFLEPRFAPDFPDTALFEGLERDDAAEVGVSVVYDLGDFYASASLQGDVSGAYDGAAGDIAFGYETELGFVMLDVSAGAKLRDANLNNYLYGVTTSEATADRPEFDINGSANAFAEVSALMPLSEAVFLYGEVSYDDLGEVFDSPLVDRKNKTDLAVGLVFQF